ncbi:MAG: MepB family protein [Flavobacteriaceae bacterium]|nr:MepB family protein [Flavobacteriaceae bacterium]
MKTVFENDLILAQKYIYDKSDFICSDITKDIEGKQYGAGSYTANKLKIKVRSSNITPTKVGQFVTFWKRNKEGITMPHEETDSFDVLVINVVKEEFFGQFIFPKDILLKQDIISGLSKKGKRGFRVYPSWDKAINKQAIKTQKWQLEFFLRGDLGFDMSRFNDLFGV